MKLKDPDRILMGMRIREQRKKLGLTCAQLAEKMHLGSKFVTDLETGSKGMSLKTFFHLVQVLEVSADYLLFGEQYKGRKKLLYEIRSCYLENLYAEQDVLQNTSADSKIPTYISSSKEKLNR